MPRSQEVNERIRDDARERIVTGARSAFARKGLAATMSEVAAGAGVSQGLAYRYFRDKDELIRAVVARSIHHADALGSPHEGPGRAVERLSRLVTALVEARRAQPELFLLLDHVVRDPSTPQDLIDQIRARGHAVAEALRQLVIDAQADGDVATDDPVQLVIAITACLDGLGRVAGEAPAAATAQLPDAAIVLRMLGV